MKLSYIEKIVLAVFVFLMTVFVGYFLIIKPQVEKVDNNKQILVQKNTEKTDLESKLSSIPSLEKNEKNLTEKIQEISGFFFEKMTTNEIDKYIYKIAKNNNLDIDNMLLTPLEMSEVTMYQQVNNIENPIKINALCSSTTIDFKTKNQSDIKTFIDAIDKINKSIIIDSFNLDYKEDMYSVSINIFIYSLESINTTAK